MSIFFSKLLRRIFFYYLARFNGCKTVLQQVLNCSSGNALRNNKQFRLLLQKESILILCHSFEIFPKSTKLAGLSNYLSAKRSAKMNSILRSDFCFPNPTFQRLIPHAVLQHSIPQMENVCLWDLVRLPGPIEAGRNITPLRTLS